MNDFNEDSLNKQFELVNRINDAKYKMLNIAISGLFAIKEQGNPIAVATLNEMIASIPSDLEISLHREIEKALSPDED